MALKCPGVEEPKDGTGCVLLTDQPYAIDWHQTASVLGILPSGWFFHFCPQISLQKMGNTMNPSKAAHLGVFYLETEALSPSLHSLCGLLLHWRSCN